MKEPGLHSQRVAFSVLAVLLLLALAGAWAKDHFTQWRSIQRRYNEVATRSGKPTLPVGLRQVWRAELGVVDRCVTCHLAMGGAEPLAGDPLFAAHPPIPHEPRELGCTPCHGGQGRATTRADAHGPTSTGTQPISDRPHFEAGCGTCHTGLKTPSPALVEKGEKLIEDYECLGCHREPGALSTVGLKGLGDAWHDRHAGLTSNDGLTFIPLADEDVPAVTSALSTRVGAPRLMAGKQLVAKLGCRGCHAFNGVGVEGEEGPDLEEAIPSHDGLGTAEQAEWHRAHLLDPPRLTKNSRMPRLGLSEAEADLVTVFLLSLRPRALGEAQLPIDRLRTSRLGERDFATDGASLYAAFCSACHGPSGEGRLFEATEQRMPALGNPVFLALADDEFLRNTIRHGRPGRRMPSWDKPGRLNAKEIDAVVGWLRGLEPAAPAFVPEPPAALEAGRAAFAESCAPCHGRSGEGSEVAPPLAAQDNEVTRNDDRIHGTLAMGVAGTAMGSFRLMEPVQLRGVIAAVRELPRLELSRTKWKVSPGDAARGEALYREHCVSCHEPAAGKESSQGPNLLSPALLSVAGDGYLTGTIIRGRPGREMPGFGVAGEKHARLEPSKVADVVAFLRSKAPQPPRVAKKEP